MPVDFEQDFDIEEHLADIMDVEELAELEECLVCAPTEDAPEAQEGEATGYGDATVEADHDVVTAVATGITAIAEAIGLSSAEGDDAAPSGAASSGDVAPPPASDATRAAAAAPWELLSEVGPSGYVYDGGRSVMRIQRGKPARSVTVNCYRHSRCTLLLTERRCPDDATLKRWLFDVPAAPPGATTAESKALAVEHMAVGKRQWCGTAR